MWILGGKETFIFINARDVTGGMNIIIIIIWAAFPVSHMFSSDHEASVVVSDVDLDGHKSVTNKD